MSIIIIKPNNFNLSKSIITINDKKKMRDNKKNINYSKLNSIDKKNFYKNIQNYCSIVDTKKKNFKHLLIDSLNIGSHMKLCEKLSKEYKSIIHCYIETLNIYQTPEYLFQLTFTEFNFMTKKEDIPSILKKVPPVNKLASFLTETNRPIFGNVMIICNKLDLNSNNNLLESVIFDDILLCLYSKASYYGVKIDTNDKLETIIYNNSAKFLNKRDTNKSLKKYFKKISGYNLSFFQTDSKSQKNKLCSLLLGQDVYGTFNMICTKNDICCDLFLQFIKNIINIFNSSKKKIINNELNIDNIDINNYRRIHNISKHIIK